MVCDSRSAALAGCDRLSLWCFIPASLENRAPGRLDLADRRVGLALYVGLLETRAIPLVPLPQRYLPRVSFADRVRLAVHLKALAARYYPRPASRGFADGVL